MTDDQIRQIRRDPRRLGRRDHHPRPGSAPTTTPTPRRRTPRRRAQHTSGSPRPIPARRPSEHVHHVAVRTATPLGTPVDPEVKITYARCSGRNGATRSRVGDGAAGEPVTARSSVVELAAPARHRRRPRARRPRRGQHQPRRRVGRARTRSARWDNPDRSADTPPPAFHIANIATTNSSDRRIATATTDSGPTPRPISPAPAGSPARRNSAIGPPPVPATHRHRIRRRPPAAAANNPGSVTAGTATAVAFHSHNTRSRSAGSSTSNRPIRPPGSATTARNTRTYRAAIASTVPRRTDRSRTPRTPRSRRGAAAS